MIVEKLKGGHRVLKLLKYGIAIIFLLALFVRVMEDTSGINSSSNTSSSSSTSKQVQEAPKEYAEADIDILLNDAKNNAAKANKDYKGKYVKIVNGDVFNIESNARYIQIEGSDPYTLIHVTCTPKNDQVKNAMINLSKGQMVTVYGKITDVGEILGYSLDMDKVE